MSNHNGNANKMVSDTPRTDEAYFKPRATMYELAGEMKRMERELNAANAKIKRMEQAGDEMATWLSSSRNLGDDPFMSHQWNKAKEAKP